MKMNGIIWLRDIADKLEFKHNVTMEKEVVDFFDTHDMGYYWEQMPEAHFDVNIKKRKHLVALKKDIIEKLTEIAKAKRGLI